MVSCHLTSEIVEPLDIIRELRTKSVEEGKFIPEIQLMIEGLKREDNVFGEPKSKRGEWAKGIEVKDINKEKAEVFFHAGCRYCYDQELQPIARKALQILLEAGLDVGIAWTEESCCGGRAFDTGYRGEAEKYADDFVNRLKASEAKILVTPCSDCFGTFMQAYPVLNHRIEGVEVLHITQLLDRLIREGKIKLTREVPMRLTYHDPCHLGRLGEPHEPWHGEYKRVLGHITRLEPKKRLRDGTNGVFDPPRNILKAIPGVELTEMERIREYSWCCGAGGGVKEAFPDFAIWSAQERLEEAEATGAEALVTACPWCNRNFRDALAQNGGKLKVYDLVELVWMAMGRA